MKEIKGIKKTTNTVYYKTYDQNGNLKGNILKSEEKQIDEDTWLKGVSCFVLNENGEVLIEKRKNKGLTPGKLDLCSGHIDLEETPTQAMIRELREELGIQLEESINVIKLTQNGCPLKFDSSENKRNFFITFYCLKRNKSNVEIQEEEVDKVFWIPIEECFELIRSKSTKFPNDYDYEEIFQKVRDICNKTRNSSILREI